MPPISSCPIVQFTRAPPPARGATAGSRSLLTRLSSAKTSVILYDKKMGAPAASPRRSPLQTNLSHGANALAHLGRPQARVRPPDGRRIERNQSNEVNDGKGHSRVSSRLEPLLLSPPNPRPSPCRGGWARGWSRHAPFCAGQSVQRGKCDRLFSSS